MEVCIDSVASATAAEEGGATRVELCGNLMEGGTTPTLGMLKIVKRYCKIPVYVMIRPRGGDFLYNMAEFEVMQEDILALQEGGADGFVFGCLKSDGHIAEEMCSEFIHMVKPLPVTFHRAIDVSKDILESLETVINLGFDRVLTSGGKSTALEGLPMIKQMVDKAKGRISIMPGGGINEDNLDRILNGCGAKEFHCSARSTIDSSMTFRKSGVPMGASLSPPEFSIKVVDRTKVKRLMQIRRETMPDFDLK